MSHLNFRQEITLFSMKSARAARPQTRVPQALADVRHDGVGHFPGCPTQGRCKVCQNNTRIMRLK